VIAGCGGAGKLKNSSGGVMGHEVIVTGENFQKEVLESPIPVLADFWAEWCVPCKMVAPILEKLAVDYQGKLKIAKINVDEEGDLASKFNIVSIPTLLLFQGGNVVKQQIGAVPRPVLEKMISEYTHA
jgi:thioredoxin 1